MKKLIQKPLGPVFTIPGILLCVLSFLLILAGCNSLSTGTFALNASQPTVLQQPKAAAGTSPCPNTVLVKSNWNPIVGTQLGVNSIQSVTCSHMLGDSSLQAVVTVLYSGTGSILDVYIYTNITDITHTYPTQLFKLAGLYKGVTQLSIYNTLLTGEVDKNSSINKGKSDAQLTVDYYREFQWSSSASRFVQVAFPGLFPDLTRFQAILDNAQVQAGHQPWKLDAAQSAKTLAVTLLNWSPNATTSILSGGGLHDINAVVLVHNTGPVTTTIKVTLSRLQGNTTNIWIAIGVQSGGILAIASPANRVDLTSPVRVTGTGSAFEGVVGTAHVLDHLYTDLGHSQAIGANGNGTTLYTASVPYTSTLSPGQYEEGIVTVYVLSAVNSSIATAAMVKALLSA